MPRYGLCDRCKEPSILGKVECVEEKPWMCPLCACEFFGFPPEKVKDVKQTLMEQYNKENKQQRKEQ